MASVSDKTQHSYADADEFIQYQLEKARSRIKATDLLTAGVLAGLLLVGYVLTFTLLDHWVVTGGFGAWTRAVLLAVVLILCGAIVFRYILRPWFRRIHPLYAARMLDRSSDEIQGSLLALVDLQAAGYKSDRAIHRTLEKRAAVTLADVHVDEAIDRRLLTRMGTALFIITLVTCVYAVLSPKSISLLRPLTFVNTNVATRTVIEAVQPGNISIPAGSQLELVADIAGVIPEEIRVLYSTSDRRFVDEPLTMRSTDDEHRFQIRIVGERDRGIRQDLTYRIEAGDAISETFAITVERPPTARVTEVRYVYPTYMDLPERTDSVGAIETWEGTTLTVMAESSEPVNEAVLQMSDDAAFSVRGEELQMAIGETQLSVDWLLAQREDNTFPKFYRIQVTNPEGHKDPEPVVYPVNVRRDAPPILKLIDPTRDLQVPANAIVPLLVEAEDPDFLLRSVTLHYAVNGKLIQPSEVLLDAFQSGLTKRWSDSWDFRLKPLNLSPGDVVTFHLEARDNRDPGLGNQSRTGDLNLQITAPVSEKQAQEQLAQDHQMQDQMRQPENSNQQDARKNQEDDPQKEQPQSVENSDEPAPKPDASDEPNQTNDGTEESQPGQDAAGKRSRDQRADDDKALQKLIQRMNRDREESGSDKNQNQNDSQDDSDRVGAESNPRHPSDKPGEPNANGSDADPDNNLRNKSDQSERSPDSPATDESSGDDTGGNSQKETDGSEEDAGDRNPDSTMNKDDRDGKKPTPGVDEASDDQTKSDPGDSNADGQKDPKNTDGAASSEPPSDVAEQKKPNTASDDTAESGSKPGENSGQQQEADKQSETPQNGEAAENSGENPGSKSPGESGTDKPPMQNENSLNMNSKAGLQSDPSKTGDETSKESDAGGKDAGGKDAGGKDAGGKDAGGKDAGGKDAGGKDAGGKDAGEKDAGGKDAGGKDAGEKDAGGKDAGGKDAGGKDAGGKDAGGKDAGGKDAGGKDAGGKDAGGKDAGGKDAGGKDAGGKDAGGKDAGGKDAGGKDAGEKDAGGKDAGGKDAGEKDAGGKDAGGKDAGGKDAGGKDAGGKDAGGKDAGGKDAGGKDAGGKDAGGKDAGGKDAGGKDAGGKDAGGKDAGGKDAGGKDAGGKDAGGKDAGGKDAGGKDAGGKDAGGKDAGGKDAGGKDAGGKDAGGKDAGGKDAGGKDAGGKDAGGKDAGGKDAGGKDAGGKDAGGKDAGGKDAGGKDAGGKDAGGKDAGGKDAGGKDAGGKEGGGKEGGGKEGSGKEGGGKEGGGKEGGGKGSTSGGQQSGAGDGGVNNIERTNPNTSAADEQGEDGPGNGGMPDGTERPDRAQSEAQERVQPGDPQADDAAGAAALAIKRLQQDLDRGRMDQKLLDELGWTEAEMKLFADRLQKQLAQRAINAQQQRERSISEKSFDAMLKGLDLKSTGPTRQGRGDYDRDQQDTTTRQSNPPSRYKQLVEGYQKSMSGAKDSNP